MSKNEGEKAGGWANIASEKKMVHIVLVCVCVYLSFSQCDCIWIEWKTFILFSILMEICKKNSQRRKVFILWNSTNKTMPATEYTKTILWKCTVWQAPHTNTQWWQTEKVDEGRKNYDILIFILRYIFRGEMCPKHYWNERFFGRSINKMNKFNMQKLSKNIHYMAVWYSEHSAQFSLRVYGGYYVEEWEKTIEPTSFEYFHKMNECTLVLW